VKLSAASFLGKDTFLSSLFVESRMLMHVLAAEMHRSPAKKSYTVCMIVAIANP